MLTKEQVLEAVKGGRKSGCEAIDSRDYARLADFYPPSEWEAFGFGLPEGKVPPAPKEWNSDTINAAFQSDLAFAIDKAEGQRGISASLMYEVVKMWLWVLEDPLQHHSDYDEYGLTFFREVAAKYPAAAAA